MFFPEKPLTSQERDRLERSLAPLTEPLQLGKAYIRLATIYKHIGPSDERVPFVASAEAAQLAVGYLRQTDDRKALASALRSSVVGFVTDDHEQADSWLAESLQISEEENDQSGIGWSHHAISTHALRKGNRAVSKTHLDLAIEIWKGSGTPAEVGMAYFLTALNGEDEEAKADDYLRAAHAFQKAGQHRNASNSYQMAAMWGEPFWDGHTMRKVLREAIQVGQWARNDDIVAGSKKMLRKHRK